jgi:putative ABC transport system permease protein
VDAGLRVAVIGSDTATTLGLTSADIGSTIKIGGLPFELLGILKAKGSSGPGSNDDVVIIPITAVQHYFDDTDSVRSIAISVATAEQMDTVKASATALLEQRHGIAAGGTDDFSIADQAQLLASVDSISQLLTILLAGIASISLVVGGIGIMNIMLVSVRERTREIGIRKAIGARGRDILAQFLVEALTLSVIGGAIGVVLGIGVSVAIGLVAGWGFTFQPMTVLMAVGFSLLVGVVFGVWPARQAARLDPIVALRYE